MIFFAILYGFQEVKQFSGKTKTSHSEWFSFMMAFITIHYSWGESLRVWFAHNKFKIRDISGVKTVHSSSDERITRLALAFAEVWQQIFVQHAQLSCTSSRRQRQLTSTRTRQGSRWSAWCAGQGWRARPRRSSTPWPPSTPTSPRSSRALGPFKEGRH